MRSDEVAARRAEGFPPDRIAKEGDHRIGKGFRLAGRDEHCVSLVAQVRDAADLRGDDGQSRGPSLEEGEGESLESGREDEDRRPSIRFDEVRARQGSKEPDGVAQTQATRASLEGLSLGSVSGQLQDERFGHS